MSNLQKNFIEACLGGEAFIEDIDEYVEKWHTGDTQEPIYSFLGFTKEEYEIWVENEGMLKNILFARKNEISICDLLDWNEDQSMVARAASSEEAEKILSWLKRTGRIR